MGDIHNNINAIVHEAFLNSSNDKYKINKELTLKAATLDAAWAKHGVGSSVASHILFGGDVNKNFTDEDMRGMFEELIFSQGTDAKGFGITGKWRTSFMSASKNLLIVRIDLDYLVTDFRAVMGAAKIEEVPADTICTVKELGYHPTIVCKGEFRPTTEITAIIELDGSLDKDLGDCCRNLKGAPVLATWFPGRQLPTSTPTDCKVGDKMTAAEAKAKGWATVSFKK